MSTPPQHLPALTDLPTDVGFFLTFPNPLGAIASATFKGVDDAADAEYATIAMRSDNYTLLDLMTYAEVMEAAINCLANYSAELQPDYHSFRIAPMLLRIPDPHYVYSHDNLNESNMSAIPSAYFGMYVLQHGAGLGHAHTLPFIITSNIPVAALIRKLFFEATPMGPDIASLVGLSLEVLVNNIGSPDDDSFTPFTLIHPRTC